MVILPVVNYIINSIPDFLADVLIKPGGRFAADVGRRGYDGTIESENQGSGEFFFCNTYTDSTIFGN